MLAAALLSVVSMYTIDAQGDQRGVVAHEDRLFMYTDGLTDNSDNKGLLLKSRELRKILETNPNPDTLYKRLLEVVEIKKPDEINDDDVCFTVFQLLQAEPKLTDGSGLDCPE